MNLLNRAVYGAAFRRHGKRLRVLPVLEKGEVRARALRSWERGTSGRWHIHCAIELPSHLRAVALEKLIRACWAKVELGYGRILVRDRANAGWIDYMLKDSQKSEFDGILDCIILRVLAQSNCRRVDVLLEPDFFCYKARTRAIDSSRLVSSYCCRRRGPLPLHPGQRIESTPETPNRCAQQPAIEATRPSA